MTRARTFKALVRARMSTTGERYTAARRHVLGAAIRPSSARASPATPPSGATAPAIEDRGAVADARVVERTGHPLSHWFDVLDRFGAVERGHTAAARHLREAHAVASWYAQGITVAYERARGVRTVNQRTGGAFAFGASKTVAAPVMVVKAAFTVPRRRAAWTSALEGALRAAVSGGVGGRTGRGFALRAQGIACRFPFAAGIVEILLAPRPDGRTTVHVEHGRLTSRAVVETLRPQWKAALAALADLVETARPARPRTVRAETRTAAARR